MPEIEKKTIEKSVPQRGLGRGLGSLFGSDLDSTAPTVMYEKKEEEVKKTESKEELNGDLNGRILQIQIEKLKANKFQPRKFFDKEKIQELALSIKEQGILQPIVARKSISGEFEIIAGERRWRAAQAAGLHQVPVIIKEVSDRDALELGIIENVQRENLNPIEEAEAYEQLSKEFGLTQQQISERVGKDRVTITNTLRLLSLVEEVKGMLISGELTSGHAKALLAIVDPEKQKEIAKKIASEKLTVRAAEKLVKNTARVKSAKELLDENEQLSKELALLLAEDLQKALGTKVKIDYEKGKGSLGIYFYSDEELNQITERIKVGTRNSIN